MAAAIEPSVTRRWMGENLHRDGSAWVGTIEYDVAYVANSNAAVAAVIASAEYSTDPENPSHHPVSDYIFLTGFSPKDEGLGRWIVTANFSSAPASLGFVPNPTNPLNDPPTYTFQLSTSQEAVDQDAYGNAILNTAGAPLVGATRNFAILTIIICRNEPIYNPAVAMQYVNKVNKVQMKFSDLFTIEPGETLLRSYQPIIESSQLSKFTRCQYQFDCRQPVSSAVDSDGLWDSWKTRIRNESRIGWYTDGNGRPQMGYFGRGSSFEDFVETSEPLLIGTNGIPLVMRNMTGAVQDWKIRDYVSPPSLKSPIATPSKTNDKIAIDTDPTTGATFLKFCMFPAADFGDLAL